MNNLFCTAVSSSLVLWTDFNIILIVTSSWSLYPHWTTMHGQPYIKILNFFYTFEKEKTNLISLAILFHFLYAQHVSDINISIIRSLRLFCWIATLVVLFLVQCVLEFRCGWVGVISVLQAEASACNTDTTPNQSQRKSNTHWTKNNTTNVAIPKHVEHIRSEIK